MAELFLGFSQVLVFSAVSLSCSRTSNPKVAGSSPAGRGRQVSNLKGCGESISPCRRGDRERSGRQRGRAPMGSEPSERQVPVLPGVFIIRLKAGVLLGVFVLGVSSKVLLYELYCVGKHRHSITISSVFCPLSSVLCLI